MAAEGIPVEVACRVLDVSEIGADVGVKPAPRRAGGGCGAGGEVESRAPGSRVAAR
jgi:hypothetical protein